MKKIGFVTPWYGEDISGGAEADLRGLVKHLHASGVPLEVLTTCVRSFQSDWNQNYHKQGISVESGIQVRRFAVRKRDTELFDAVNAKLMSGQPVSDEEESIFCREMINSPQLYDYMQKHESEYKAFVFIPYMFGTTYFGCQICPRKTVLIPCLHDESYAYMKCFRTAFSNVYGMILNAEPERKLAQKLFGGKSTEFITLGVGLDTDWEFSGERFREKYHINSPFILYAGRKDSGKRVDVLIRYFVEYKQRNDDDLKLVLIGGGKIDFPDTPNIIDLGFVDKQDKYDAYAAASIFCNPSQMESFSLVIMESWLAGRPVLANGDCAVTRDFVVQTNGGLYYENYPEFEKCVQYLLNHTDVADQMGKNGNAYVRSHFSWDVIVKRYTEYLSKAGSEK